MKPVFVSALISASVLLATPALANKELDLATKSGCLGCHAVDKKMTGPAYRDVAKKYAHDKGAEAHLIERVKKGTAATGGQVWKEVNGGAVPMPPATAKEEDIKTLIKWILSGAK